MVGLGLGLERVCFCCNQNATALAGGIINHPPPRPYQLKRKKSAAISIAAKSSAFSSINSVLKRCQKCGGKGAIDCPGCKGTGKNKKNGNIFERWKCFECQGFGLKSCPECGKGGLTPEQRGER